MLIGFISCRGFQLSFSAFVCSDFTAVYRFHHQYHHLVSELIINQSKTNIGDTCSGYLYHKLAPNGMQLYLVQRSFKLGIIIIIMTRSIQPKPPAVAIFHQNGLSSASCRASVAVTPVSRHIW